MSMSPGDARPYLCKLLELVSCDDWPHYNFSPLLHWLREENRKAKEGEDSVFDAMHTAIDCCEHEEAALVEQGRRLEAAVSKNIWAFDDPKTCPFEHENIATLYGVPVIPIADLPKLCTCGRPLTYADVVCFINGGMDDSPGNSVFASPWLRINPSPKRLKMCEKCQHLEEFCTCPKEG